MKFEVIFDILMADYDLDICAVDVCNGYLAMLGNYAVCPRHGTVVPLVQICNTVTAVLRSSREYQPICIGLKFNY